MRSNVTFLRGRRDDRVDAIGINIDGFFLGIHWHSRGLVCRVNHTMEEDVYMDYSFKESIHIY